MAGPESQLVLAYRALIKDLEGMVRVAEVGGRNPAHVAAQLRAAQAALRDVQSAEAEFIGSALPAEYRAAGALAAESLATAGAAVLQTAFTRFDRAAVRHLQERVADSLGATREALTKGLALGDPRTATAAIVKALETDGALVRIQGGALKVATPSGQFWDPEAYARMLGRTAVADSRRTAFGQRYLQNGVDVVVVVANGTTHDVCARWEGERLSLTGATPGLPTVEDARAEGLFHPNCRHRYIVDVESLPAVPEQLIIPEEPAPALPILGRAPPANVPEASSLGAPRTAGMEPRTPSPRG